ncbi:hypothetical protein JCM3774_003517 [Rhodotorula dairenensis]
MPLDAALYTLLVRPRANDPGWIDLNVYSPEENATTVQGYALHKDEQDGKFSIYDPFTLSRLGTSATAPPSLPNAKPNPKHRLARLFDPDVEVHLWNQPGLGWSWDMEWEESRYVWIRDVASLLSSERGYTLSASRKPDPNFPILQYHPHRKGGSIEILDHNIARVEPPIRDRKGLEVASLLALCFFIEHIFPASPVITTTAPAAGPSKVAGQPKSDSQPAKRKQEEMPPPAPMLNKSAAASPPVSSIRPHAPCPRIDIVDLSPKALDVHYRYCLALLQDLTLSALELGCPDAAGADALKALADRIKRKRLKLSRGSDSLDIHISTYHPRQAEPMRGGWLGFFQADNAAPAPSDSGGISVRLSRSLASTASNPAKQQLGQPASGPSQAGRQQASTAAAPPPRKVSPRPPAPPARPPKGQTPGPKNRSKPGAALASPPASHASDPAQTSGSGWLSIFGQRAKG